MSKKNLSATITIGGAVSGSLGAAVSSTTSQLAKIGKVQEAMNKSAKMMGAGLASLGVAGAVIGSAAFPVKAAVDFENAMLGVAKQVAGARDASGKLTPIYHEMAKELQTLGRSIPMSTNALAEMAAAGARMDIPREQLIEFTRTAAMMAEAFELPAGELADQMGKIQKLFGLKTQGEVRSLADSINFLDDNAISKGGDIIDFLQRSGGAAGSVKVTGSQMAALGSTLLTLGESSDTAGTSVKAIFAKLGAAEKGTKKFRSAMAKLHLSLSDVQKGMQVDAQGTLLKVLDKVRALPKDQQIGVLTQIVGLEHAGTMAKLANGVDEYRKQIALANSEGARGSMAKEFEARLQTTTAQWEILKNKTTEFAVNIGATLLPKVNELTGSIGGVVTSLTDWSAKNPETGSTIIELAKSIGIAAATFGVITTGIGAATYAFNALKLAVISNPIGATVALLVTAGVLIYQHWDKVRAVFTAIGDAISPIWEKTKRFMVGFGGYEATKKYDQQKAEEAKAAAAEAAAQELAMPAPMPQWRSSSSSSSQQNNITIHQQPGQDAQALARAVAEQLGKQNKVQQRGMNFDPVGAY
jgi:TP901 family phage tail tape measure protein